MESLLTHLFMPRRPDDGKLDPWLLECFQRFISLLDSHDSLDPFMKLTASVLVANPLLCSVNFAKIDDLTKAILNLSGDKWLMLYMQHQNAVMMLKRHTERHSAFIVCVADVHPVQTNEYNSRVHTATVGKAKPYVQQLAVPQRAVVVDQESLLKSLDQLFELLRMELGLSEGVAITGANQKLKEEREVNTPHLLHNWYLPTMASESPKDVTTMSPQVTEFWMSVRNDAIYQNGPIWRRSSSWLAMKMAARFVLVDRFGVDEGTKRYKLLMALFRVSILDVCKSLAEEDNTHDVLLFDCMAKLTKCFEKLPSSPPMPSILNDGRLRCESIHKRVSIVEFQQQ
jgi:hypothetical protein